MEVLILYDAGWSYAYRLAVVWKYYYYLNSEGIRVTGWQTIAGKEYYFDQNGVRKDNIKGVAGRQ